MCYFNFTYRIPSDELFQEAQRAVEKFRSVRLLDSAGVLVHDVPHTWGSDTNRLNTTSLALAMAGRDEPYQGRHGDAKLMSDFLVNTQLDGAVIPPGFPRRNVIPGGVPIFDILRAVSEFKDSWKFPSPALLASWGRGEARPAP